MKGIIVRLFRILLVLSIVFFLLKVGVMEWLERQLVFYPSRLIAVTPSNWGLKYEDIFIKTSDGVRLHGWFVPTPSERARLLFFHGNAGNIGDRAFHLPEFVQRGISVLFVDYRGFGQSEGVPSELGIYADAEAALDWLKHRKPGDFPIVYYGESLGSAVAIELAVSKEPPPQKIILEGGFSNARDMAKVMYSFLGSALPLTYEFDSVTKIQSLKCPLLSIHGTEDDVVPFALGQKLFDAHPGPKEFYAVKGAHHNDLLNVAGAQFYERVQQFIFGKQTA
ncbi:MAG: alpha/beta hydrolase [Candidatus Omnitrophica bacterium]|nr:alpha/beta hydrolase [Candidatus Omnitrophota bacterium]